MKTKLFIIYLNGFNKLKKLTNLLLLLFLQKLKIYVSKFPDYMSLLKLVVRSS